MTLGLHWVDGDLLYCNVIFFPYAFNMESLFVSHIKLQLAIIIQNE